MQNEILDWILEQGEKKIKEIIEKISEILIKSRMNSYETMLVS